MKKSIIILTVIAGVVILFQDFSEARGRRNDPCRSDVKKLCSDKNRREIGKCLMDNYNDLSDSCKKQVKEMKTCHDEFNKYCKEYLDDRREMGKCIKKNYDNFSEVCQKHIDSQGRRGKRRDR